MSNANVSQTTTTTLLPKSVTKKKYHKHHKHHKHHHHHHHKQSKNKDKTSIDKDIAANTTQSNIGGATATTDAAKISQNNEISSAKSIQISQTPSTTTPTIINSLSSHISPTTTDDRYYFIEETPTSTYSTSLLSRTSLFSISIATVTTKSRLLSPPRDNPVKNKRPLSSSFIISSSSLLASPSPSIIQPIPAVIITASGSTSTPSNNNNNNNNGNDDNSAYRHRAQIHLSIHDLGLGLGLGFGGFSILALGALLIQNYKKRQRNRNPLRSSNQIDNNGVFFTEKPSMFKKGNARNSNQNSFIYTKWRPQSFLGVVANVVASKFPNQSSSNSFPHIGESGTVDYDLLTFPKPLYSPVKASYHDDISQM